MHLYNDIYYRNGIEFQFFIIYLKFIRIFINIIFYYKNLYLKLFINSKHIQIFLIKQKMNHNEPKTNL